MRTIRRDKRLLYLCKRYTENNVSLYKEPIPLYVNYEPVSNSVQMLDVGNIYNTNMQITADVGVGKLFTEGDKCYVKVAPPSESDKLAKEADYIVYSIPSVTPRQIKIILQKVSKKGTKYEANQSTAIGDVVGGCGC